MPITEKELEFLEGLADSFTYRRFKHDGFARNGDGTAERFGVARGIYPKILKLKPGKSFTVNAREIKRTKGSGWNKGKTKVVGKTFRVEIRRLTAEEEKKAGPPPKSNPGYCWSGNCCWYVWDPVLKAWICVLCGC